MVPKGKDIARTLCKSPTFGWISERNTQRLRTGMCGAALIRHSVHGTSVATAPGPAKLRVEIAARLGERRDFGRRSHSPVASSLCRVVLNRSGTAKCLFRDVCGCTLNWCVVECILKLQKPVSLTYHLQVRLVNGMILRALGLFNTKLRSRLQHCQAVHS